MSAAAAQLGRLRAYVHAFRQLGFVNGTKTAARRLVTLARGRLRAIVLARRPIALRAGELDLALGAGGIDGALAAAAQALPSVTRWQLDEASLISRADALLEHRFDLLGSGPTALGPRIDWQRDFKSGRSWPLVHISRVPISYPDASDIKVPWELSRCQHLPLLAAAYRVTGERRYLDEIGAQLTDWIAANPVEFGANWACTMDVAIRGVNWVATLVLLSDEQPAWLEGVLGSLLLHARFIRSHLEWGTARGNHYLSDVVGLLVIASLFARSAEGLEWVDWAVGELGAEMDHQVRADGCDHEASIPYHRLVTELFIVGADAADALAPGRLAPRVRERLELMLQFVADYTRPDGLAPQIGDADDGRLLPLGDYGILDFRSHAHLFTQSGRPYQAATAGAAYRAGGYFFMRSGELYVAIRCGDVGLYGRGCHAHNDLLGFELCYGDQPLVIDPGSYLYTADPHMRNAFRSTAAHSTIVLDGAEQNEIRLDRLFAMVDRARAEVLDWQTDTVFKGRHHGFEPAVHTRELRLDGAARSLEIVDRIDSAGAHALTWSLVLAPCTIEADGRRAVARFAAASLVIESDGLDFAAASGWYSRGYGVREATPVLRAEARTTPGAHVITTKLSVCGY